MQPCTVIAPVGVEADVAVCAAGEGVCAASAVSDAPSRKLRVVVMRRRSLMRSSLLSARNRVSKSNARDKWHGRLCAPRGTQNRLVCSETCYGVQVAAIILTLSTFNVGAADAALAEP